jgi:hypothetical protein
MTKREELTRLLELASALADLIEQVANEQEPIEPSLESPAMFPPTWN